jgi:hypothetical protein
MKNLILALVLFPSLSFAGAPAPLDATWRCDGKELAIGDTGRTGTVDIHVTQDGKYVNSPWKLDVKFAGEQLAADGIVCGVRMNADCDNADGKLLANGLTVFQRCGLGAFDTRGLPHMEGDAVLALSDGHGRVACAAHDAGKYAQVELSNCR